MMWCLALDSKKIISALSCENVIELELYYSQKLLGLDGHIIRWICRFEHLYYLMNFSEQMDYVNLLLIKAMLSDSEIGTKYRISYTVHNTEYYLGRFESRVYTKESVVDDDLISKIGEFLKEIGPFEYNFIHEMNLYAFD